MLKYERSGMTDHLEIHGSVSDIVAEVTWMIRRIHKVLERKNSDAAAEYKKYMAKIVGDEESPVWMDTDNMADRLIGKLEEILGILKPREEQDHV